MDLAARVKGGTLHGSAAALDKGRGVLLLGASGTGKSALALKLMAYGAHLVADDRVILSAQDGRVLARAPDAIKGRIEARGIGVIDAIPLEQCAIRLVVNLDRVSDQRLPHPQHALFHDVAIPLISAVQHDYFAPAILQILKASQGVFADVSHL